LCFCIQSSISLSVGTDFLGTGVTGMHKPQRRDGHLHIKLRGCFFPWVQFFRKSHAMSEHCIIFLALMAFLLGWRPKAPWPWGTEQSCSCAPTLGFLPRLHVLQMVQVSKLVVPEDQQRAHAVFTYPAEVHHGFEFHDGLEDVGVHANPSTIWIRSPIHRTTLVAMLLPNAL